MAKKQTKLKQQQFEQRVERAADVSARVLQGLAIISVVAIFIIMGVYPKVDVPIYVIAGLLGAAVGLSPAQIGKIVTDVLKSVVGKK